MPLNEYKQQSPAQTSSPQESASEGQDIRWSGGEEMLWPTLVVSVLWKCYGAAQQALPPHTKASWLASNMVTGPGGWQLGVHH